MDGCVFGGDVMKAAEKRCVFGEREFIWELCWLFAFGSLIGFFLEGIWEMMHGGPWVSHATLVWGPFCPVYGLGAVVITVVAQRLHGHSLFICFVAYALAGSLVELAVSLLQEGLFRAETWNYSDHAFNLDGRISLKMTILWGVLGLVFSSFGIPLLFRLLRSMRKKFFHVLCVFVCIFLTLNFLMSGLTLQRWRKRKEEIPAANMFEEYLDRQYGDTRMERTFSNLRFLE